MAEQLGISRTVVLLAYDQLLAEGFAVGRSGSGTYVSSGVGVSRSVPSENPVKLRLSRFGLSAADCLVEGEFPAAADTFAPL